MAEVVTTPGPEFEVSVSDDTVVVATTAQGPAGPSQITSHTATTLNGLLYGDGSFVDAATVTAPLQFTGGTLSLSAALTAIGSLTPAADRLAYFTGTTTAALATFTAFGRTLVASVSAAAALASLGVGTAGLLASDTDTTLAANSDSRIATQKAVKAYVDQAVTGLLDFKGSTDCSANPNYPAGSKGDAYVVSVAGRIGGASGKVVDVGDVYVASADNAGGTEGAVGTSWFVLEHNLQGALLSANNLSDVASVATARTNLGLGALATANVPGATTQVIYNLSGALAGSSEFTYTTGALVVGNGTTVNGTLTIKNGSRDMAVIDATDNCKVTLRATSPHGQEFYLWARHPGTGSPAFGGSNFGLVVGSDYIEVQNDTPGFTFRPSASKTMFFKAKGSASAVNESAFSIGKVETAGTPGAGWGVVFDYYLRSSTTQYVLAAQSISEWVDATHATRTSRRKDFVYDTAAREVWRGDTDGSGANFSFFGAGSYGSGRNVVFIPNGAVVPSTNPTGGGILYAEGGALKWRGSGGTVTTIAGA